MLLGLDIGTSSCKTTILDSQTGEIVASARHPLNYLYPDDERAEINAEELWQAIIAVMTEIAAKHPKAAAALKGMSISIVFPTLVPLDANDNPQQNAILYSDRREQPQIAELKKRLGEHGVEDITGNALVSGTSILPGILWLKQNRPEQDRQTKTYATLATFIIRRLTGVFGMDPAHASLSALCPKGREHEWSQTILDTADIDANRLPPVRENLTVAGTLLQSISDLTGLPAGLPVVWSNGDSVSAAFAAGVAKPGEVFVAGGSTDCLLACSDHPSGNPLFCNVRHLPKDVWTTIGSMNAAGASVKWLCESFLKCPMDDFINEAAAAPSGSRGLLYLPYLLGERTPVWDPKATGVFFGLTLHTGRAEACRAVLEGVACAWRQILELLLQTSNVKPDKIVAAGGGSTNHLWNQIKASMLKCPVVSLDFNDVSSLGACLAAGLGVGVYDSMQQAFDATANLRNPHPVMPVPEWEDALDDTFQRYLKLYPTLKPIF